MTITLERPATTTDLSPEEVQYRVAVLKRFRELLSQQRDRFAQYLEVLDKQKDVITKGSADSLIAHVELEEKIVADIFAIQKVIDPLNDMYQTLFPADRTIDPLREAGTQSIKSMQSLKEEKEVPDLKAALEELKSEAIIRSNRNKDLLANRMKEIRLELKDLRSNPYAIRRSVYSGESPSLVDISG